MKQSKKLLSVILAIIMVFSSVSIVASARAEWLDGAVSYNNLDKAVLTTEQFATAALDEVDRMLDKEQIVMTQDEIFVGDLDLTSVDNALDSVNTILNGSLWTQYSSLLGDLQNLDISALTKRRRSDSDLDVINSLLKFLYDNSQTLLVPFIKGNLDMGAIVKQYVPDINDLDVSEMVVEMLYKETYDTPVPETITTPVDTIVQDLVDKTLEKYFTTLYGHTNLSSGSMYAMIDDCLKTVYNNWVVPKANGEWMEKINEELAKHPDEVAQYRRYFKLTADGRCNFTFPTFNFTNEPVAKQLNNLIGSIVNTVLASDLDFNWTSGDNSKIITNIIKIGREVLVATGDTFFASYVEVKTPAELAEMSDMEVCAYVARTIVNSSIDSAWVPASADTLVEVANYTVRDLMATEIPSRDYSSLDMTSINSLYTMLSDFGVKALNENPGLGLSYGIGVDELGKAALGWVIDNYGGLLSGITLNKNDSVWTNADKLLKVIFDNYSWFDKTLFPNNTVTFEYFVKTLVIDNVINLNFTPLFDLLANQPSGSELNNTPKLVALRLVARTLNLVFPGVLPTNMTTFADLISKNTLGDLVGNLFSDLYNYRAKLVPAVLPIVCDALSLTNKQEFKTPSFEIDAFNACTTGSVNLDFKITNRSSGVNTAYTTTNGTQVQDSRYAIQIVGITCQGFTVATPSTSLLKGGQSVSVKITGSVSNTRNTKVVVTYNVLKEDGTALTTSPLTANIYTCISKTAGDALNEWTATSGTYQAKEGLLNLYVTSVSGLDDLEFKFKNTSNNNATMVGVSAGSNTAASKTLDSLSFMKVNDEQVTMLAGGMGTYQPYVFDGYTGSEEQDAEAFGTYGFQRYTHTKTGVKIGTTEVTKNTNVCLYKDYDLTKLFNSEVNAQRQASDYDATAYANYVAAMDDAATLVQTTRTAAQFINTSTAVMAARCPAAQFQAKAEALENAVEALVASATGGVTTLEAYINTIEPDNDGIEYDEAGYNFQNSSANYKMYTWSNYRKESREANSFVKYYTTADEETGVIPVPTALDVTYTMHRLSLYYGRLLPVSAVKTQLNRAITEANAKGYDASAYTEDSWSDYTRAINFANTTKNTSSATQNQVNVAYEQLIKAQKRLIEIGGDEPGDITVTAAATNPGDSSKAPILMTNSEGDNLLLGVFPSSKVSSVAGYFDVQGGTVTFENDSIGTGKVINVKDSGGDTIYSCKIVLRGDVDGDGATTVNDVAKTANVLAYFDSFGAADSAAKQAADIDNSGVVDVNDMAGMANVTAYVASIDYANVG